MLSRQWRRTWPQAVAWCRSGRRVSARLGTFEIAEPYRANLLKRTPRGFAVWPGNRNKSKPPSHRAYSQQNRIEKVKDLCIDLRDVRAVVQLFWPQLSQRSARNCTGECLGEREGMDRVAWRRYDESRHVDC